MGFNNIRYMETGRLHSTEAAQGGVYTLRTYELLQRVSLYIKDDHKQLVALNVLQQLVVRIDQPDGLLWMFFDVLLDEKVIQDETSSNGSRPQSL